MAAFEIISHFFIPVKTTLKSFEKIGSFFIPTSGHTDASLFWFRNLASRHHGDNHEKQELKLSPDTQAGQRNRHGSAITGWDLPLKVHDLPWKVWICHERLGSVMKGWDLLLKVRICHSRPRHSQKHGFVESNLNIFQTNLSLSFCRVKFSGAYLPTYLICIKVCRYTTLFL